MATELAPERKDADGRVNGLFSGGFNRFGWCIARAGVERQITVLQSGVAQHAAHAVQIAFGAVEDPNEVVAAAIDGPLVWPRGRARRVDDLVRVAYRRSGGKSAMEVVQHPHSLRASCVLQSILLCEMLREQLPDLALTESHPRVLRTMNVQLGHTFADADPAQDAILCTVSGWAMVNRPSDWLDLLAYEKDYYSPLAAPLAYWMPAACQP